MTKLLLLERIRKGDNAFQDTESKDEVFNSIRDHLQKLLNIRIGSIPVDQKLGLNSFNHFENKIQKNEADQLCGSIKSLITNYEKRLHDPKVAFVKKNNQALIEVHSQVKLNEEKYSLSLKFGYDADKKTFQDMEI